MKAKTIIILVVTNKCTIKQLEEIYKEITNFIGIRHIINYDNNKIYHIIGVNIEFTKNDAIEVLTRFADISPEILDGIEIFDCSEDGNTLTIIYDQL